MEGIAFFLNAPDVGSWVQIAKQGRFRDPRYGQFSITQKDFASWIKNFSALNPEGLPIDVDHSPEKRGETEAAGWIKQIEQRGNELWALPDWNSLGKELVADKRFLYLSPSYHPHFKDEQGKDHGTALVGVALTNRPFLNMATISLSQDFGSFASEEEMEVSDNQSRMELTANILTALKLSEDADEAKVLDAIKSLEKEPEARSLDDLAKDEGKVVLDASQVQELVTKANAGESAANDLKQMKFESAWTVALDDGKVVPTQKESFEKLYGIDSDTTMKTLEALQPVVNTSPRGAGGHSSPVGGVAAGEFALDSMPVDTDALDTHNKALVLAKEREIGYVDAVAMVQRGEA